MVLENITSAMRLAEHKATNEELLARLDDALKRTAINRALPDDLAADMRLLISNSVALLENINDEKSHIDSLLYATAEVCSMANQMLTHVARNRATLYGYGIEQESTSHLMAQIYPNADAAQSEINQLGKLGVREALSVVPVRVTSQLVSRPSKIDRSLIPPTPTQPSSYSMNVEPNKNATEDREANDALFPRNGNSQA